MNKNVLLLVPLGLVLAGCPKPDTEECFDHHIPPTCLPLAAGAPINVVRAQMKAVPPNACVQPGQVVTFELQPTPTGTNTFFIEPKDSNDTWLSGTNYPNADEITITVPNDMSLMGTDHDYGLRDTETGKCADPRVRVETLIEEQKPVAAPEQTLDEEMDKAELTDD